MELDLSKIIATARSGDPESFRALYDLFAQRLYRFIVMKVRDGALAEDILQDTFVKAWKALPDLPLDNLQFSSWLYKIAANCTNDYFRKKYRTPETVELEYAGHVASDFPAVAERMDIEADMHMLQSAMQKLPPAYRQVLELRFVQDFSMSETADILGKTRVGVGVLQYRALSKLKSVLQNDYALEY